MFHHYYKIFLLNHLLPNPDVTNMIKNRMNDIITFVTYDEYLHILEHGKLKLPKITYFLEMYDHNIDPAEAYEDIKYGKRAGVIFSKSTDILISLNNCFIRGCIDKFFQNDHGPHKYLNRNDVIII